jgi:HEAT repeats/PBS lyase HEAT-like repeat
MQQIIGELLSNKTEILPRLKEMENSLPELIIYYVKLRACDAVLYSSAILRIAQIHYSIYNPDCYPSNIEEDIISAECIISAEDVLHKISSESPQFVYNFHGNVENISTVGRDYNHPISIGERIELNETFNLAPLVLLQLINNENSDIRKSAIEALGEIGDASAISALLCLMKDSDPTIRLKSIESLSQITFNSKSTVFIESLMLSLQDADYKIRSAAVEIIGKTGDSSYEDTLIQMLQDESIDVRASAARALGHLRDMSSISDLTQEIDLLVERISQDGDFDMTMKDEILKNLSSQTGQNFRKRLLNALKSGGVEALKNSLPLSSAVIAFMEGLQLEE